MRAYVQIAFEVEADDDLEPADAQAAAAQAAFDYLAFVTVSGVNTDTEWVEVHVDGFGKARVKVEGPVDE